MLLANPMKSQTWEPFGNTAHDVTCLYYDSTDNSLYIGGIFLWFDSLQAKGLVKWDGQTFSTVGDFPNQTYGIPPSTVDAVSSIIRFKDEIYCSMRNGAWNPGEIRGIAKWNGISWDSIAGIDGQVFEQIVFNNELYIMGRYWERNDSIRSILKWDGNSWHDVGFQAWLGMPYYITILAATVFEGELYIGGNFWNSDQSVRDVAKFDGTNWHPVANGIKGGFDDVGDLVIYKDELYACGDFKASSGNAGNKIMKLKDNEWVDVGGSFEQGLGTAFRMLVYNDKLYVFGDFDNKAGGVPVHKIAIWDGERWCGLDHDFNKGIVYGEVYDGDLIIGGGWEYIDGQEIMGIARWTGGDHVDSCSMPVDYKEVFTHSPMLDIFPNPSSHKVHVGIKFQHQLFASSSLCIVNLFGQNIYHKLLPTGQSEFNFEIEITGWNPGLYLLTLQSGNEIKTKKIVVY